VTLELVKIPAGQFRMGAPDQEAGRSDDEGPQHEVKVPSFWMGKYPVTQAQWKAVAALPKIDRDLDADPSNFKGDDRPVEQVSWDEAIEFCQRLSKQTGREYRLPSEAEWEYACRAGTTTPFHFGETITTDLVNYDGSRTYGSGPKGTYRKQTTEVGNFSPNAFGLYDMHGNVWEWCLDHWHKNYGGAPTDGSAWTTGGENQSRLLRGGSWRSNPQHCRSADRAGNVPDYGSNSLGFRVVCSSAWTL
jgi:formylglycine-generating enzyme required for sulfatase activity